MVILNIVPGLEESGCSSRGLLLAKEIFIKNSHKNVFHRDTAAELR